MYVPLPIAREWSVKHRNPMSEVALALARQSGELDETQSEGYSSAVVRVSDPVALTEVRKQIKERGFASVSIVDQLDQIRTVFLIIDSVLGLLGGISLLVASFGIANTMIMSILERTREIGIMKAIGAEDREIKLIFFFEAAVIGLTGGVLGCWPRGRSKPSRIVWPIASCSSRKALHSSTSFQCHLTSGWARFCLRYWFRFSQRYTRLRARRESIRSEL